MHDMHKIYPEEIINTIHRRQSNLVSYDTMQPTNHLDDESYLQPHTPNISKLPIQPSPLQAIRKEALLENFINRPLLLDYEKEGPIIDSKSQTKYATSDNETKDEGPVKEYKTHTKYAANEPEIKAEEKAKRDRKDYYRVRDKEYNELRKEFIKCGGIPTSQFKNNAQIRAIMEDFITEHYRSITPKKI